MTPAELFPSEGTLPPSRLTRSREKSSANWMALARVIALAVLARAWLHFTTPYVPGVNGAYYLVQARSLIEHGVLGIPDMPLTFYLHAALASLLTWAAGLAQADAILWAVKLCDSVLPPLAAWPVFVVVRRWAAVRGLGNEAPFAAAVLACLASPLIGMVGEFQKNSLALVWLAALAVTLHDWLDAPTRRNGAGVLVCLLLLGLTHIGVLGSAVVLIFSVLLVFLALNRGVVNWRQFLPWVAAGVGLLGLAAVVVLWKFDPARIYRLFTALTNPAKFSSDGLQMPMMPGGGMGALRWLPSAVFALAVVPSIIIAWRRRNTLPSAEAALVTGSALTVLVLTGPWFSMDKSMRFNLIALLPAILVAAFAMLHISTAWRRWAVLSLALCLGLGGTVSILPRGGQAILSDSALLELQNLRQHISRPAQTLVCAQHGVEWWSAWFLRTRISQPSALRSADWQRYAEVLFLEVKSGMQMPMFAGGGRPPGFGPHRIGPPGTGMPDAMPPPTGMGPNPMMPAPIPPDAQVLHNGQCLKLARIVSPPQDVLLRAPKLITP